MQIEHRAAEKLRRVRSYEEKKISVPSRSIEI
jgi:hypothetical protein